MPDLWLTNHDRPPDSRVGIPHKGPRGKHTHNWNTLMNCYGHNPRLDLVDIPVVHGRPRFCLRTDQPFSRAVCVLQCNNDACVMLEPLKEPKLEMRKQINIGGQVRSSGQRYLCSFDVHVGG
jgi:hypothetical protein